MVKIINEDAEDLLTDMHGFIEKLYLYHAKNPTCPYTSYLTNIRNNIVIVMDHIKNEIIEEVE